MKVQELNQEQYKELCQQYITDFWSDFEDGTESPSFYDLACADELVSQDVIYKHYDGVNFTEDDFFSGKKQQNKWEKLFEDFLDTIEFGLIKHHSNKYINPYDEEYEGQWSLVDLQGANLGGIEQDRFKSAAEIVDRLDIYIKDYIFDDLEDELYYYNVDLGDREIPWSAHEWLKLRDDKEFYTKNKKFFDSHSWGIDVLQMMVNFIDEVNLENVFYEEAE